MDKELAQLEEWAVNLINDYESSLRKKGVKPAGPGGSEYKRIGRFSGELVANPEAYGELLDMAKSKKLSAKDLLQSIRSIEANLLDEASRGTATSRKQLMSDVIHHLYAQRTGGDTLRRLAQSERSEARKILRDSFGRWGNVPENLQSLFRSWHLSTDKLKGIEAEALQELGITSAGQLTTTKAHTTSPVSKLITGTQPATTGAEAAQLMAPQFEVQRREGLAAIEESKPLMQALNEIAGSEYSTGMSAEELAVRRNVLAANPEQVKAAIQQFASKFTFKNGKAVLNALPFLGIGTAVVSAGAQAQAGELKGAAATLAEGVAGEVPIVGDIVQSEPVAGGTFADVQRRTQEGIRAKQLQQRAAQARQRGGKIKIGFGSVKFALPEFGLSELMGLN